MVGLLQQLNRNTAWQTRQCVLLALQHTRRRCSSETAPQASLERWPKALLKALGQGCFTVMPTPGAGRGLVAVRDIPQGTDVLRERPLAAVAASRYATSVCCQCLAVLEARSYAHSAGGPLCASCTQEEEAAHLNGSMSWRDVEAHADFAAFRQRCQQQGARFPLLAARLACVKLAAAASLRPEGHRHTPSGSAQQDSALQGNVLNNDMDFLCYANLQPGAVPQEWQHQWALLRQGLLPAAAWLLSRAATQEQQQQQQIRNDTLTNTPKDADRLLQELGLDLDWYAAGVMARAHVNAFRVDTLVLPPYGGASGMDLAAAAAAMLSESEGPGSQDGSAAVPREGGGTGSAVYVVASLVNHSCEPNLDVIFPTNNSLLALRAARDIAAGEELTISYIDNTLPAKARQRHLLHGYGFKCACTACREELQADGGV